MRKPTIPDVPKDFWTFHQWQSNRALIPVDKIVIWMINMVKKKGSPFNGSCKVELCLNDDRGLNASILVFDSYLDNRTFSLYDFNSKECAE